jgi:hypothetical protein
MASSSENRDQDTLYDLRHRAVLYRHLATIKMSGSSAADWHLIRLAGDLEDRAALLEEVEARSNDTDF